MRLEIGICNSLRFQVVLVGLVKGRTKKLDRLQGGRLRNGPRSRIKGVVAGNEDSDVDSYYGFNVTYSDMGKSDGGWYTALEDRKVQHVSLCTYRN